MARGCAALTVATAATIALAGSPVATASGRGTPTARAAASKVTAIYAGSLVNIMEKALGPEFTKATGYPFEGFGGGSHEDAVAIKGKVRQADAADKELERTANGNWVSMHSSMTHT